MGTLCGAYGTGASEQHAMSRENLYTEACLSVLELAGNSIHKDAGEGIAPQHVLSQMIYKLLEAVE